MSLFPNPKREDIHSQHQGIIALTSNKSLTEKNLRLREKANIETALQQTYWKIYGTGGAAERLGLKPTTLLSRIKKIGIVKTY